MTAPFAVARGRKLWFTVLGLAALTAGVQSCDDAPVEPKFESPEAPRLNSDPDEGEWEILGPFTIPGGANWSSSISLPSFPVSTMMEVVISGYITSSHASAGTHQIGPQGQYVSGNCWKNSGVQYGSVRANFNCNGSMSDETVTAIRTFSGSGTASIGGGNTTGCSAGACAFTYTGDRTVTLRIPRPKLKLEARDTVFDVATMPDTVRFVASWSPTHLGTLAIPAQLLAWRWQPDTASQPTNVTTQCMYPRSTYTCMLNIRESGTMFVDMRLNGQVQTAELHVEVKQGDLTLDAIPTTIYPNDSVTFATGVSPDGFAYSINKWWWVPDVPPILAAKYGMRGAVRADEGGGGTTAPDCSSSAVTCRVPISESGTMYVEGAVSGQIDTASAHVTVHQLSQPVVTCDTVSWGATATCRVVAPAGATYTVGTWNFAGPVSVPGPSGVSSWSGQAVISGTVTADVTFNGQTSQLSAPLVVSRRSWTWGALIAGRPGTLGEIDACFTPGTAGMMSGQSCSASNPGVLFTPVNLSNGTGFTAQSVQDSGPNGGVWYVAGAAATMQLRTQIHIEFRSDGPAHPMTGDPTIVNACASALGTTDPQNVHTANTQCQQVAGFNSFVAFVWSHEDRHMQAALAEGAQARSDVHSLWEPLVANSESTLTFLIDGEYNAAHTAISAAAQATHTGTHHDFSFWRFVSGAWGWHTTRVFD